MIRSLLLLKLDCQYEIWENERINISRVAKSVFKRDTHFLNGMYIYHFFLFSSSKSNCFIKMLQCFPLAGLPFSFKYMYKNSLFCYLYVNMQNIIWSDINLFAMLLWKKKISETVNDKLCKCKCQLNGFRVNIFL